jgi:hypothetical protein
MADSDKSDKRPAAIASLLKLQEDILLPHSEEADIEHYLYERYAGNGQSWTHRAYYHAKRFLPRSVQLALRRKYASLQRRRKFPAWPIEPTLVSHAEKYIQQVFKESGKPELYRIAPWPDRKRCAFVITHDVEWDAGLRNAHAVANIEKRHGFVSSWNIVPERYPIDWRIVDTLRSDGCEIGVHGLKHDGNLFHSRGVFNHRVEKIHQYAKEWRSVGFRSPSTHRNVEWMPDLEFEYDSSFPDTDPYEPQAGGCCSIWPFFIGNLVELPLTMPQDHTLFEILGHTDISVWKEKGDWIEKNSGLILVDVHPDYMVSEDRLQLYEEFLLYMKNKTDCWHALPADVARWWRERDASCLRPHGSSLAIEGPAAKRASILRLTLEDEAVKEELLV